MPRDTDPARAARLGPAVETLRSWDRVSRQESVAMTLYTLLKMRQLYSWITSLDDSPFSPPAAMEIEPLPRDRWDDMAGLEKVTTLLERDWGTWQVPYGELSRLQRSPDGRYTDQAELYGRGEYKPAWTTLEEVRANAVRSYRPGAEKQGGPQ